MALQVFHGRNCCTALKDLSGQINFLKKNKAALILALTQVDHLKPFSLVLNNCFEARKAAGKHRRLCKTATTNNRLSY